MNESDLQCDIAIIGGGISGLYAADRLRGLLPNHTIRIFERAGAVGGRIFSAPLTIHPEHIDLGAGRYDAGRHLYLHRLVEDLGIRCVPFAYDIAPFQNGLFDFARAELRETCVELRRFFETCPPKERQLWSFWEGANHHLGGIKSDFIVAASGYDSLRNPKLPFKHGIDILFNHPETSSLTNTVSAEWLTPQDGFQSVPRRLAERLTGICSIDYHHALRAIHPMSRDGQPRIQLDFDTGKGKRIVDAKQVIHASAVREFLKVDGCSLSEVIAGNIVDVPLVKGCVEYETSWWRSTNIAGCCFTNPSPFRKIYFPRNAPYLLIYTDGDNAISLRDLTESPNLTLQKFESVIRDAIPFAAFSGSLPRPVKQVWKFWESGISFWDGGFNLFPDDAWSYAPNIHVCSDLFTEHVGWVEGGIVSAEAGALRVAKQLQSEFFTSSKATGMLANIEISPHPN